jgi:hypothetical protein
MRLMLASGLVACLAGYAAADAPDPSIPVQRPYQAVASCLLTVLEAEYPTSIRYEEISAREQVRLTYDLREGYLTMRLFMITVTKAGKGSAVAVAPFNDIWRTKIARVIAPCLT